MLRPEQMSKVSVTGAKSVMDDVIETLHDLHLVHITDYDGSWEGFQPGDSLEGADETSGQLVTVRAIESILDVSEDDVGATTSIDLSNADERLEEVRQEVNELDERRDDLRSRQRDIAERLGGMELFADLGIDLDLLWGYDSLSVLVGEGDAGEIDAALANAEGIDAYDVFSGTDSVAVFAQETADNALDDAIVGVRFTEYVVPEETGDPESYAADLENERQQIESELERVESELETLELEHGGFLLALEEKLSIDAEKFEAPLRFATTERSFIVEGWVPTRRYEEVVSALRNAVGDRVEIDEIERASHTGGGHPGHDDVHDAEHGHEDEGGATATDGGEDVAADGGTAADGDGDEKQVATDGDEKQVATDGGTSGNIVTVPDDPPVIQRNPDIVGPFELLTKAVNRPKYSEFDPTFTLSLTFPLFFGFMIGDIGYGLAYLGLGYWVAKKFDSDGLIDFGKIVMWLGVFTIIFGVLYGEIVGLHFFEWFGSHPPLEKGLSDSVTPEPEGWAFFWLIAAVILGWLHLNLAYLFDFVEQYQLHGFKEAFVEVGSWLIALNGLWVFVFSKFLAGAKPDFLVGSGAILDEGPFHLGFTGFPEVAGMIGAVAFFLGIGILLLGPWYEAFEFAVPLAHPLSYTRLTAVLLAKAGMALAANLLYWGAYQDEEGFHFLHTYDPNKTPEHGEVLFGGLSNMGTPVDIGPVAVGIEGALLGLPVLIIAHLVVLAVGGTAAIQAIRLEYFEFFEKFYEGGGRTFQPFGYDRAYTTDT